MGKVHVRSFQIKLKHYNDSNMLVVGKMNVETGSIGIQTFVRLKPKMYSILINHSREYEKGKWVNKNVVAKISDEVLWNKICLRHSINRIQLQNLYS